MSKMIVEGPLSSRSGYGDKARSIAHALVALGHDPVFIDTPWGTCPRNNLDPVRDRAIIDRMAKRGVRYPKPDVYIRVDLPNAMRRVGRFNILMTSGVETDRIPPAWVDPLNENADLIVTPSAFTASVIQQTHYTIKESADTPDDEARKLQVKVPVEVLFEGINPDLYNTVPVGVEDLLSGVDEEFCFLFVGHWIGGELGHDRKDVGMLIKTFAHTFRGVVSPPALLLKTSNATFSAIDRLHILQKIKRVLEPLGTALPPVYLIHGDLSEAEMAGLYRHPKVKACVSFTKGEGFGRPLLEATLADVPVAATAWSGHLDFLSVDHSALLPGRLAPVHPSVFMQGVIEEGMQWATVDYSAASAVLKDMFGNYKPYATRAKQLGEINRARFTLERMKTELGTLLEKYIPIFPTKITPILPDEISI